jgi:hypothetical protein
MMPFRLTTTKERLVYMYDDNDANAKRKKAQVFLFGNLAKVHQNDDPKHKNVEQNL